MAETDAEVTSGSTLRTRLPTLDSSFAMPPKQPHSFLVSSSRLRVGVQLTPGLNPSDHAVSQLGEVWVYRAQLLSYLQQTWTETT